MGLLLSASVAQGHWIGGLLFDIRDVTFDASLATGGEAVSLNSLGFGKLIGALDLGGAAAGAGYRFQLLLASNKLTAFQVAGLTPAGTVAAPTFTGSALAAHRHSLFVATGATDATGARVNAATNSLAMNNAAATIAGIAAASGTAGGVVDVTAGTPAGTNSAPAFTGTAVAAGVLVEASGADLHLVVERFMFLGM